MSQDEITAFVIADIALVVGLSSLVSQLLRRLGQPAVIGQILTGIALGPSLLGRFPGHLSSRLFPPAVLPYLSVLSQVGVVIFMFAVAYELDLRVISRRGHPVVPIALSALIVPIALGSGAALLLPQVFATTGHSSGRSFILFVGVATAVSALPVLAAIAREHGIAGTLAGVVATSAAGIMDALAWLLLAAAVAGSARRGWLVTALLVCCLAATMLLIVRPALRWWFGRPAAVLTQKLPIAIVLTMGSAYVTTLLGLHPVFGGFLAGLTMPRTGHSGRDPDVLRSMENASSVLLPLFFAVTGLSLDIGALRRADLGLLTLIVVIACAGKLGPAYLSARLGGLEPRQAATVSVLLNTRGLTELVALNIGLQARIISPALYTVFVIMALITTATTSPLLLLIAREPASHLANLRGQRHEARSEAEP